MHERNQLRLIASSGRDRVVQVFRDREDTWELMQTLDEHVGAVNGLLFSQTGSQLLSSSSDRTVVVREAITRVENGEMITAFLIVRTITLKATPLSMTLAADCDNILIVSTIDRIVQKIDLGSGHTTSAFKAADSDNGDAVIMCSLVHISAYKGPPIIAGVCSTDKSIRLYDESGCLLGRDWGHTEGITDIALITCKPEDDSEAPGRSLVTVAADGTIFVWNLEVRPSHRYDLPGLLDPDGFSTISRDGLATKFPLRRVLSQSEIARFPGRSATDEAVTPTGSRTPTTRKGLPRLSMAQIPKLDPSPLPGARGSSRSPGFPLAEVPGRGLFQNRSPSPPSPRNKKPATVRRPSLLESRARTRSAGNVRESGGGGSSSSLIASTDQLCRTLRTYRKKLAASADALTSEAQRELERELGLTVRAVGEKAVRAARGMDESIMAKLLDQYSERLVELLDGRIAASVARQVRHQSEQSGESGEGRRASAPEEPAG